MTIIKLVISEDQCILCQLNKEKIVPDKKSSAMLLFRIKEKGIFYLCSECFMDIVKGFESKTREKPNPILIINRFVSFLEREAAEIN